MKLVTNFIRAAVEGKTVDGRFISAEQINQMAQSYSPDTYSAKITLEHVRGLLPDGVFKSLGNVVEVMAETIKEGALSGKRALLVKLEPHTELINMVRNGQKNHLSIEMHPEFPTTGGAYLFGVGVTDTPASIGVGVMNFSVGERPEHTFSEPLVADIEIPAMADDSGGLSLFKAALVELRKQRDQYKTELEAAKETINQLEDDVEMWKCRVPADGFTPRTKTTGEELDREGVRSRF